MGAETVLRWHADGARAFALVGVTPADARDVMIQGESGIMKCAPPWDRPEYEPSKRLLTWKNGAYALIRSGADPEGLRGPQFEKAWCDELCAWQYPQETWDMLMFGLRQSTNPQAVITSTPKPIRLLKTLIADPSTIRTRGSTYDNKDNLSAQFIAEMKNKYEGTRLGRQELEAEILDDNPAALWNRAMLDSTRVHNLPTLRRIVVAIDPAITATEASDETGIIVAGEALVDGKSHGYLLDDCSIRGTPAVWAAAAIAAYNKWHADRIIGEANQGGDMVEHTIHSVEPMAAYKSVHATKGKYSRAEPVSALYEQGRCHHMGTFGALEDQFCEWEQGSDSPDRLDAAVWAFTELMLGSGPAQIVMPGGNTRDSKFR